MFFHVFTRFLYGIQISQQIAFLMITGLKSTAHVLNGCKNLRGNYSKRHDRIVEKVGFEIKTSENKININKTVKTSLQTFGFEIENDNEEDLLKLRPDLLVK